MPDTVFLNLLKTDKNQAFRHLMKEYQNRVLHIAFPFTGNSADAEDITQEVFIKIFNNIEKFRGMSKLSTWIYRITVNTCKNFTMRTKKTVPLNCNIPAALNISEDNGIRDVLHEAISRLPFNFKSVIILKDIEGKTRNEISEILKCRPGTVDSRLFRARNLLKKKLKLVFRPEEIYAMQ
ncbi:MAG: hypothetical protein A2096_17845 [Spirochaetes bacterium GWF1_41_5]|nr:MAG: hypothetical protein A2096_17845 [Spirochaetes bacterium GWF1_41_5]HBE01875.1 RNA polymerase subunit sigma [Spirochaetia bacterium]